MADRLGIANRSLSQQRGTQDKTEEEMVADLKPLNP